MKLTLHGSALFLALPVWFVCLNLGDVLGNALAQQFESEQFPNRPVSKVVSPAPAKRFELSVYSSKYDNGVTKYGHRYRHWKSFTCASNNPAHKLKTLRITWNGITQDLLCTDTGGDKRLGYTRIDISGAAMLGFRPKWNRKDKGAPLLKLATVEVLK